MKVFVMGSIFEQLQKNAKIAKDENKKLEQECSKLQVTKDELAENINDLKKDKTEH
jgi:predicted  nucleic acid-binding Zn-ribbon protein